SSGSSIGQRGKKVVRASSGKTTSFAPWAAAFSSSAIRRSRVWARVSARWMGPVCAPATRRIRLFKVVSPRYDAQTDIHAEPNGNPHHDGADQLAGIRDRPGTVKQQV